MNFKTIALSSNSSNYFEVLAEVQLEDMTTIYLNLSGITESTLPLNLKIDWGNNDPQFYDNNTYKKYRTDSILNEILYGKFSSILTQNYENIYYPSETSLYKSLSAQVYIQYGNGDASWFIIPIKIRTSDYFESIYDLKLINSIFLPLTSNTKKHIFTTSKDGYIIESHS